MRRQQAHLVFGDECGLLMAPLLRRSLAPRGQPLALEQQAKHREKVSLAGALWLAPGWKQAGLFAQTLVNDYFDSDCSALVLEALVESLPGAVVVLWDRGQMHQGASIRDVVARHPRLSLEAFPAYAPELNPVEQVWKWLKYDQLCNYAPPDVADLEREILRRLGAIQEDQRQLCVFCHTSDLPFPRTLLS